MKIILVGATGTIGQSVYKALAERHEVISACRTGCDVEVDITSSTSIEAMFEEIGEFDALICAAGDGYIGPLEKTTEAYFLDGLHNKLQGQISLVLLGQLYIRPGGSFTLTSGLLGEEPVANASNLSVINAGIDAFVRAAAIELSDKDIRINAVSPAFIESEESLGELLTINKTVSLEKVVPAYLTSVEGTETGKIYKVF